MLDFVDYTLKVFSDCYLPLEGHNEEYTYKFVVSREKSIDDSDEDTERVGYLSCSIIDCCAAINANEDLREIFDSQSSDYLTIFNALFTRKGIVRDAIKKEYSDYIDRLLVLDRLALSPSERGKKLGHHLVNQAIKILGAGCDLTVCIPGDFTKNLVDNTPQPADWQESTHTRTSLQAYYGKIDFKQIGSSLVFARLC
jgi:GNAT superfamily N-acetyltransferase